MSGRTIGRLRGSRVLHYHLRHPTSHAHRVVGSPVLGVNLSGIGQIQAFDRCPVVGNPLAVVQANDGLSAVDLVVVVIGNPGWIKFGIDFFQVRDVFGQPLTRIPPDHPIFSEQYGGTDLSDVVRRESVRNPKDGRVEVKRPRGPPVLEGHVVADNRYGVIFSPLDMSCALETPAADHCSGYSNEDAARIGINLILYSLHE